MTTPTRPLPPGVEIKFVEDQNVTGWIKGWKVIVPGKITGIEWAVYLDKPNAIAAYWAWHDAQPENQAKGEPKYDSPGYRAGYAAGLESAERVISDLTARVAALEAKDQPKPSPGPRLIEGMNQLRDAVRNGTLDQLPTTVVARCGDRTVRYTREPEAAPPPSPSAEPSHREPVVGMVYRIKDATDTPASSGRWMLMPNGEVKFNECTDDAPRWEDAGTTGMELRSFVASGYFVPVPGYKVEVTP